MDTAGIEVFGKVVVYFNKDFPESPPGIPDSITGIPRIPDTTISKYNNNFKYAGSDAGDLAVELPM